MARPLAVFSFAGLVASLVVHIAALRGIDVGDRYPAIWLLHIGMFFAFVPFALRSRRRLAPLPGHDARRAPMPSWAMWLGGLLAVYALVNFALFARATEGGSPSIRDGKYLLQSHGHLIREITAQEYAAFRANEVRGFSGHWLVFYFLPLAYFAFVDRPEESRRPDPNPS